ncbi:MAG TPA: TolC family protein [Kofleriaceae bacterium]|nr:TolC family protein [Kofleriaceae bacterium]
MRAIAFALVSVLALSPARADSELDTARETPLTDLFAAATKSAPALESVAFSLAEARAQQATAEGPHDLTLAAIADYQRVKGAPSVPGLPGDSSTTKLYEISLRKLLPTNGLLELVGNAVESDTDLSGMPSDTVTSAVKVRLTQPLLRGVGPAAANRLRESAKLRVSAAGARRAAEARAFAVDLVRAYWELSLAWRKVEIARASADLAKKQQTIVEGGIRTGKLSQSEVYPVQQAFATRQQDIALAELDVIERSIALRRLVGLDVTPEAAALKPAMLRPLEKSATAPTDVTGLITRALEISDELRAAREEKRAADAALAGARRERLPRADLELEAGPLGTATTLGASTSKLGDGYTVGARLTIEVPLGNHTGRGIYESDHATAVDATYQLARTRNDVAADVTRMVHAARAHLVAAQEGTRAVEAAVANVDAETKKFELGKSTSAEIVRRQDELQDVRLREAIERTSYEIALAELDAATGAILEKNGLKLIDPWF